MMGMENKKKEVSKKDALAFLQEKLLAVVSTVSADGRPESATVIYFIDDDFNFYFATRHDTRKVKNLERNGNVAIVVGAELSPNTVQMEGIASPVSVGSDFFVNELAKHSVVQGLYFGPFLKLEGSDFETYKVRINWLRFLTIDKETGEETYSQVI